MVTLADIAEKSGVSLKTVSNVVNGYVHVSDKMRKKVMEEVIRSGYVPNESARRLAHDRNSSKPKDRLRIGCLIMPGTNKYDDPFHCQVLSAIESEITKTKNLLAFIANPDQIKDDPILFNYLIHERPLDGLITFLWHDEMREFMTPKLPHNLPIFGINYNNKIDSVNINFAKAIRLVIDHLEDMGHKKIGFIGVTNLRYGVHDARYRNFKLEMQSRYLELRKEWMPEGGDFLKIDSGVALTQKILEGKELPTALVCANDYFAISAMKALYDANIKVPQDISVIGFDNIAMSDIVTPELTTIDVDKDNMGRQAVQHLLERISDHSLPIRVATQDVRLVKRKTVAPAKN